MKRLLVIPFIFLCCGGRDQRPLPSTTTTKESRISKSVLIVIAPKDFRDEEFKEPYELLTNSGIKVVVASTDTSPSKGMLGAVVKPEMALSQVNPDSFKALIIVGGTGCKILWDDTLLHKIVQHFEQKQKPIAAICIAPVVLARAGVLKNKKATVYPGVSDEIKPYCAEYTAKDVEISANIITGSGPQAADDFAKAILEAISK